MSFYYDTIAMDPPWPETGGGKSKRGADRHYQVVAYADMAHVILNSGVWQPNPDGANIWMWTTVTSLAHSIDLLRQLNCRYVTHAAWAKSTPVHFDDGDILQRPQTTGLGQRLRITHELLLYATHPLRGYSGRTPPIPEPRNRRGSVIYAPRGKRHSAKPREAYDLMEAHDGPGRKLEMFARSSRPGWSVWGVESGGAA